MTSIPASVSGRSTAEEQRPRILGHALHVFAKAGYHSTPITDVAAAAKVSPAYVFRLFGGKKELFIDAVDSCYDQVAAALQAGGKNTSSTNPTEVVEAMTAAYIELIADRDLIALQVHAQSACDIPEVRDAVQRGLATVTHVVAAIPGVTDIDVQRFIAYGQLCHLIVQAGLTGIDSPWAKALTHGIRHL